MCTLEQEQCGIVNSNEDGAGVVPSKQHELSPKPAHKVHNLANVATSIERLIHLLDSAGQRLYVGSAFPERPHWEVGVQ